MRNRKNLPGFLFQTEKETLVEICFSIPLSKRTVSLDHLPPLSEKI
jgi:hypothetical protein